MTGPSGPAPSPTTAEMLARLVSFDTTSRNSNLGLIGLVRGFLDEHGVPYRISLDRTGEKANLHAVIGPQAPGGIAFSGHVDTVPVDGQAWQSDPFTLRREDGRLYARGACDMKGFVAACLAAVPDLKRRSLKRPVHLFISYDEEVSFDGARRLIEDLQASRLKPDLCVVGEPSGMRPIVAHKGKFDLTVTVRGLPGHSSEPAKGVNAVHAAGEAIAYIAAEARRLAAEGPFEEGFDPPHTTIHVGVVHGGTILNIVPEHAGFDMEWRPIPGDDARAAFARLRAHVGRRIEPAMKALHADTGFTYAVKVEMPGLSLAPDHVLTTLVQQVTDANSAGKVSYGTEGGFYQNAGIATIVCGPGHIAQAHQPNEWIAESELVACDRFIRRLVDRVAT
jgi:acetylornithine deacetylase